jgi:hypothetical protein
MKTLSKINPVSRMSYFILPLSFFMLFFASCSQEGQRDIIPDENPTKDPVMAQFTSKITGRTSVVPTKASNSSWSDNDRIGIFMVKHGSVIIADSIDNKEYRASSSGVFTAVRENDNIFLPDDGSNVDFIAYYPYLASISRTALSYPLNVGGDQTNRLPALDLLYAATSSGYNNIGSGQVEFTFRHQLSKLVLNVLEGDGISSSDLNSIFPTIIGLGTQSSFNLERGTLAVATDISEITPHPVNTRKFEAIILPQTVANAYFEFLIPALGSFIWHIPEGTQFAAATEYTYNVTITRTGIQVSGTITAWDTNTGDNNVVAE